MIPNYLSRIWAGVAPALGNHIWQSTLCVLLAGLLAMILRKNRARARYGLWLAASLKFLIPFSLLISFANHLARPHAVTHTEPGFVFTMQEVGQPFTPPAAPGVAPVAHAATSLNLVSLLPAFLLTIWFCGFAVVLLAWYVRWRRISASLREATPLRAGREVEALRRIEELEGIRQPIGLLLSPVSLEPGIFGILRPILVWPEGISERLDDAQLEAILAHELRHVRRRDNLAAAIHMVVEAIFWFHPLVWWLGAWLVEEREHACDEGVLESGSERQVYAQSILKTCEFYLESPLACMSGVTGADLKKRIVRIMTERSARKLDFRRKLLIGAAGLAVVALPVMFGTVNAPQGVSSQGEITLPTPPRFDVVSIKLYETDPLGWRLGHTIADPPTEGTFNATDVSVETLVQMAYGVQIWCPWKIQGAPSWLNSERFDIRAKAGKAVNDELRVLSPEQGVPVKHRMLQTLLVERFKLALHRDTKNLPEYVLGIAKNGPKFQESPAGGASPDDIKGPHGQSLRSERGQLVGNRLPMSLLAELLSTRLGCPVLDQTGLKGIYDFTLQWPPDQSSWLLPESSRSSLFAAIQQQLGLKLESTNGPVEVLVIDHAERPSEN